MKRTSRSLTFAFAAACGCSAISSNSADMNNSANPTRPTLHGAQRESIPMDQHLHFSGALGARIQADLEQWLLIAPDANPGMLEMFAVRDRQPVPNLVPWAGEFVGKYLTSAIEARSMIQDPRLDETIARVIKQLIASQADDGYLGPFPKADRLLGNWDLWGHYHVMYALTLWHEQTGDAESLACARRAADLICKIYLNTDRRVLDAGSPWMNMSIIHGMARLYRATGEPRYLQLAQQVVKEWEVSGDFLRKGLDGTPFYLTVGPRWESLHNLLGMGELYRITGDEQYRTAFLNLWNSIRERDRHPSGGFSTWEQALGNPYADGPIETCCVIAWVANSVDALQLTSDSTIADELELSTWNAVLGAQHPSGRWWTYNTPINGAREASAHTIVFQSRAGTPELNCCSVNAPRGLGMLGEWAVTSDAEGLFLNFYGPSEFETKTPGGDKLNITQHTDYPTQGKIRIKLGLEKASSFSLRLRIPAWSANTTLSINGEAEQTPRAGEYFHLDREWKDGDEIALSLDMTPRHWTGAMGRRGMATLFAGPLLLAADQADNSFDTTALPTLDLAQAKLTQVNFDAAEGPLGPLVRYQATWPGAKETVNLRDFASAGVLGTHYAAWLPVVNARPTPAFRNTPRRDQSVAPGPVLFEWSPVVESNGAAVPTRVVIARDLAFTQIISQTPAAQSGFQVVESDLKPGETYYWKTIAGNAAGKTDSSGGAWPFHVDPALANDVTERLETRRVATDGRDSDRLLLSAQRKNGKLEAFGTLIQAPAEKAPGVENPADSLLFTGIATDGVRFSLPAFPQGDFTLVCTFNPSDVKRPGGQQIFSAWSNQQQDPLRLIIENGNLNARIENGQSYASQSVPVNAGTWYTAVVVREGTNLSLFLDGKKISTTPLPQPLYLDSTVVAFGMNPFPLFSEHFYGQIRNGALYARAFSAEEIVAASSSQGITQ